MKELIDKAALLDRIESEIIRAQDGNPDWSITTDEIMSLIRLEKPVEPETVDLPHGYWERRKDGVLVYWRCTACKKVHYIEAPRFAYYCPGCGAKMDADPAVKNIADGADMIVNGFAFTRNGANVSVQDLHNIGHSALLSPDGDALEKNMNDIEVAIVLDYYKKNRKYADVFMQRM